jgi:2-C-methyl-D-erythritol 4-phosphate cytidylyltransferase
MNYGVILAAGNSTRFQSPIVKQLYSIDGKPMVSHSIDIFKKCVDEVIVVTNSRIKDYIPDDVTILVNDEDSRLKSISCALNHIKSNNGNLIIHDAARPYINEEHIKNLLSFSRQYKHVQYYLPIVDGLAKKGQFGWETPNREDYIQLCSPQLTDLDLFKWAYNKYFSTGGHCEMISIMSLLSIESKLIEGSYRDLRKITYLTDIY